MVLSCVCVCVQGGGTNWTSNTTVIHHLASNLHIQSTNVQQYNHACHTSGLIPNLPSLQFGTKLHSYSKGKRRRDQPGLSNGGTELLNHSLGSCSIAHSVFAHVLKDLLTVVVLVPARVLVGPLDRQRRPCVVVETAHVVSSTIVVLGIKQPGRK